MAPVNESYKQIKNPRDLYDRLCKLWSARTCPERMREGWTAENPSWGQCSISSFLAQDIFGGEVYGILRPQGNYHCYNLIDGVAFDLTSEQFGEEKLDYSENPLQSRNEHFSRDEKRLRYELLKARLEAQLRSEDAI